MRPVAMSKETEKTIQQPASKAVNLYEKAVIHISHLEEENWSISPSLEQFKCLM